MYILSSILISMLANKKTCMMKLLMIMYVS
jgi:hypothetical protein